MSLKEKAKTAQEWYNTLSWKQFPRAKLVLLKDAQKEIDSLEKQIEKEIMIRCGYSEQIVKLKQKLQPHRIVCLVGSTDQKWQEQYRKVNRELCLAGYLVVTVSLFKTDVDDIEKYRSLLESIHFQKIRLSDVVVLIHKDAVGEHTLMELEYCKKIGKPVVTFENIIQTKRQIKLLELDPFKT